PFTRPQHAWAQKELRSFAKSRGINVNTPFLDLPDDQRRMVLNGASGWRGVKGFFSWLETKKYKLHVRVFLAKYRGYTKCPECDGQRLRQEARDVKIGGRSLPEIVEMSIRDAYDFRSEEHTSELQSQSNLVCR